MGYHALIKPVLFFAAGNIHQSFHTLEFRLIGPGVVKTLPVTVILMGLAAVAATGLPPFGLFYSELAVIGGGFAAHRAWVSVLILAALIMSFCGILQQLARIFLGTPKVDRPHDGRPSDGVAAMGLLLGSLLVFSLWLPLPVRELLRQAARVVGGEP
jgi:hydrogenase-4 component F